MPKIIFSKCMIMYDYYLVITVLWLKAANTNCALWESVGGPEIHIYTANRALISERHLEKPTSHWPTVWERRSRLESCGNAVSPCLRPTCCKRSLSDVGTYRISLQISFSYFFLWRTRQQQKSTMAMMMRKRRTTMTATAMMPGVLGAGEGREAGEREGGVKPTTYQSHGRHFTTRVLSRYSLSTVAAISPTSD